MDLKIYGNIDSGTINQIYELAKLKTFENQKIRIMPDAHQGKGAVIGFTSTYGEEIIPNVVGVDLGCGMFVVKLGKNKIDLEETDKMIAERIPMGTGRYRADLLTEEELKKSENLIRKIKAVIRGHNFNIHVGQVGSLGGGEKIASVLVNIQ